MNKNIFKEEFLNNQMNTCGRTVEEEIQTIENYGNHGVSEVLRNKVLKGLGLKAPKAEAKNGLIFGCYRPFTSQDLLRNYIRLLDFLNIDYVWFEKEYCCGWPIVGQNPEKYMEIGEQLCRRNIELADEKNVTTLVYCCVGCAYAVRHMAHDSSKQLVYVLDIILDEMEKRSNKIKPVTVGYFEGCHSWYQYNFPQGAINWARYRKALDQIDGLTVIDLPNTLCCKRSARQIIETTRALNLDGIICPCNGCHKTLTEKSKSQISILSYPEILLQSLGAQ